MTIALQEQGWAVNPKRTEPADAAHGPGGDMDWFSRFVLAWELSNSLESDFCVRAL
jgi:hypothetical protein